MSTFDLRDVALEAQADIQSLLREVVQELMEPQIQQKVTMMWAGMPEEMKAQFQADDPAGYAALMDLMK